MPRRPSVDLDAILRAGGAHRVALFQHCVKSVTMEPMFLFLAQEYASRATRAGALALYDAFCAPNAVAKITAPGALPPDSLRLAAAIGAIRRESDQQQSAIADPELPVRSTAIDRHLFNDVAAAIRDDRHGPLAALAARYDPQLSPVENLPGGTLNGGQRHFVDMIWRPRLRPRLVASGFWQISTID
jgi:hypothetical protein